MIVSVTYEEGAQTGGLVEVTLQPQHGGNNRRDVPIGRKSDSPERLTDVLPDIYKLTAQVISHGNANRGYVASAKLGDLEVLHSQFSVGGSVAGDLHLTIRGDGANVEGTVTQGGEPAPGAQVYLIPTSSDGGGYLPGFSDPKGHYQISGVPPGDYRVQAWTGSPSAEQVLADSGQALTLQPSEQRTVPLEAKLGSDRSE